MRHKQNKNLTQEALKTQKGVKSEKRISKFETNSNYRNIKYCFPPRRQGAEILGRNVGMLLWPEAGMRNLQFYVRAKLWNKLKKSELEATTAGGAKMA